MLCTPQVLGRADTALAAELQDRRRGGAHAGACGPCLRCAEAGGSYGKTARGCCRQWALTKTSQHPPMHDMFTYSDPRDTFAHDMSDALFAPAAIPTPGNQAGHSTEHIFIQWNAAFSQALE